MLEAANAKGAVGVVNVRFEAVRINNNASELLSYGTRLLGATRVTRSCGADSIRPRLGCLLK